MSAYFFNVSNDEKNNILDQHKKVYDGFVTTYGQQINQQPLYVQDYANDKGGIVVNNKGDVKNYTNVSINESDAFTGAKYLPDVSFDFGGPDDEFDGEYNGFDGLDMIGDSESDMEHGTFDEDDIETMFPISELRPILKQYRLEKEKDYSPKFKTINVDELDDEFDVEIEPLQEQVNKTLDMFKRFKKY